MTSDTKFLTETHEIMGGHAKVYRTSQNGGFYQLGVWVASEGKMYRRSLRTKHLETAIAKAEQEYIRIRSMEDTGKRVFSENVVITVNRYIDYRQSDVVSGQIVSGRLSTIAAHLRNMLTFLDGNMNVSEIHKNTFKDYYNFRKKKTNYAVNDDTIRNEYSTIRMWWKWLYSNGLASFTPDQLEFQKFNRRSLQADVRRDTFTDAEYKKLHTVMRSYASKKNCSDEHEYHIREVLRNYILILANTGLRTGEADQLKWGDILEYEEIVYEGDMRDIVYLNVRAETSKVRKTREVICREAIYFRRIAAISEHKGIDDFIFATKKGKRLTARHKSDFWNAVISLSGIQATNRKLTPYSLRHYFITQRWNAGVSLKDIAMSCGTSAHQVEKVYYHLNRETLKETALRNKRAKHRDML
jgi:integrase